MAINVKPDSPNTVKIESSKNTVEIKNDAANQKTVSISTGATQTVNISAIGPQGSRGVQGIQGVPGNITGSVTNVTASGNISASGNLIGNVISKNFISGSIISTGSFGDGRFSGRVGIGTKIPGIVLTGSYQYPSSLSVLHISGTQSRIIIEGRNAGSGNNGLDFIDGVGTADNRWIQMRNGNELLKWIKVSDDGQTATDLMSISMSGKFEVKGDISSSGTITAEDLIIKDNATVAGNLDIADTIYHTGDSNTKIRFPAVDTIAFHTSGNEQMVISSGGHITASGNISASGTIYANNITASGNIYISGEDGKGLFFAKDGDTRISASNGGNDLWLKSADDMVLNPEDDLMIRSTNGEYVRFDGANKRVGIGTTSPTDPLDVTQSMAINSKKVIWDNGSVIYMGNVDDSSKDVRIRAGGSDKMIVRDDGKVGIGTVNPSSTLTVEGNISSSGTMYSDTYRIKISDGTFQRAISSLSSDGIQIGDADVNDIRFKNAIGTGVTIKSTGLVGIGTTSPAKELTVKADGDNGGIKLEASGDTGYLALLHQSQTNAGALALYDGGSQKINIHAHAGQNNYINNAGNFGIGTTSPQSRLTVDSSLSGLSTETIPYHAATASAFTITGSGGTKAQISMDNSNIIHFGHDLRLGAQGNDTYDGNIHLENAVGSTDRSTRLFISSSGDVGIGTVTPTKKLQVAGDISASGTIYGTTFSLTDAILTHITASGNISASGTIEASGNISSSATGSFKGGIKLEDNGVINIGTGNDFKIYHSGNHSYISDQGTGNLFIQGTNMVLEDKDGTDYIAMIDGAQVDLKHAGTTKLSTTSSGVNVLGNISASGNLNIGSADNMNYDSTITVGGAEPRIFLEDTGLGTAQNGRMFQLKNLNGNFSISENGRSGVGTTSTNQVLTITSSGEVGIKNNNPPTGIELTVGGDISASGHLYLQSGKNLYFNATDDTYLDSDSTDRVRVIAGGQQMMVWDYDTGNRAVFGYGTKVYIGNNNNYMPTKELMVEGDISASGILYASGAFFGDQSDPSRIIRTSNDLTISSSDDLSLIQDDIYIKKHGSGAWVTFDGGNNRVGIGTASPTQTLEVKGIVYASGSTAGFQIGRGGYDTYRIRQSSGTGLELKNITDDRVEVKVQNGRVGIGTTTPRQTLDLFGNIQFGVASGGTAQIKVMEDADTSNSYRKLGIISNNFSVATATADEGGSSLTRLFISQSTGNVGIGTTTPYTEFDLVGTASFGDTTDGLMIYRKGNVGYIEGIDKDRTGFNPIQIGANGSTTAPNLHLDTAGNVGIKTNNPTIPLDVRGNAQFYGSGETQVVIRAGTNGKNSILKFIEDSNVTRWQIISNEEDNGELIFSGSTAGEMLKLSGDTTYLGGNLVLTSGSAVADIVTNHAAFRRDSGGGANIDAPGNIRMNIDSNANQTNAYFTITKDSGSYEMFRVQENGHVGINSSSPSALLELTPYQSSATLEEMITINDRLYIMKKSNAVFLQVAAGGNQFELTDGANGNATKGNVLLRTRGTDDNDKEIYLVPDNGADGGRVGIGFETPTATLHISSSNDPNLILEDPDGSALLRFRRTDSEKNFDISMQGKDLRFTPTDTDGTQNVLIGVNAGSSTIDSRLGVGAPDPKYAVDVSGSIRATGDIIAQRYIVSSSTIHLTQSLSSGSTIFGNSLDDTHQLTGSVRISGSLKLADRLTISQTGAASVAIDNTNSNGYMEFQSDFYRFSNRDNSTQYVHIKNDGNVGIGTTSPTRALNIHEASSGNVYLKLSNDTSGNTAGSEGFDFAFTGTQMNLINRENGAIVFETDGTERARIRGNGQIDIGNGTGTSGDAMLHISTSAGSTKSIRIDQYEPAIVLSGSGAGHTHGNIQVHANNTTRGGGMYYKNITDTEQWYWGVPYNAAANKWQVGFRTGSESSGKADASHTDHAILSITQKGDEGAGYVGIGTSTPAYNLDVQSGSNAIIRAYGGTIGRLSLQNNTRHYSTSVQGNTWYFYDETGGNTIMVVSASRLGIGTTSPDANLDIEDSSVAEFRLKDTGGTGYVRIQHNGTTGFIGTEGAAGFNLLTNGSERVSILSGGNVGIGTTSPSAKLEVFDGDIKISGSNNFLRIQSDGAQYAQLIHDTSDHQLKITGWSGTKIMPSSKTANALEIEGQSAQEASHLLAISSYGSTGDIMYVSSSGNVGIGKTNPPHKLDIKGSSPLIGFYGSGDEYRALIGTGGSTITGAGANDFGIRAGLSTGNILFSAGGATEMMRISASGNVGIGTSDPLDRLHISGSTGTTAGIKQSRAGTKTWSQQIDSSGRLAWGYHSTPGGSRTTTFTLDDNNNVGIGVGAPETKLHIVETGSSNSQLRIESTGSGGGENVAGINLYADNDYAQEAYFRMGDDGLKIGTTNNENITFETDNGDQSLVLKHNAGQPNDVCFHGAGSSNTMFISESGQVGIAGNLKNWSSSGPTGSLCIDANQTVSSSFWQNPHIKLQSRNTSNHIGRVGMTFETSTNRNGYGFSIGANRYHTDGRPAFTINSHYGNNTSSRGGGNEIIRVDGYNNRVGIGVNEFTSSVPSTLLHVKDNHLDFRVGVNGLGTIHSSSGTHSQPDFTITDQDNNHARASLLVQGNAGAKQSLFVGSSGHTTIGPGYSTDATLLVSSSGGSVAIDWESSCGKGVALQPANGVGGWARMFGFASASVSDHWGGFGGHGGNSGSFTKWFIGGAYNNNVMSFISSSNRVGVGTTDPKGPMHIMADSNNNALVLEEASGNETITFNTDGGSLNILGGTDSDLDNEGSLMYIKDGGNVGIGTTSPDAPLHISSSDNVAAIFGSTDSLSYISFLTPTTDDKNSVRVGAVGNQLQFIAGGSEAVRINGSGYVGIGTDNPGYELSLQKSNSAASMKGPVIELQTITESISDGEKIGSVFASTASGHFAAGVNFYHHDPNDGEIRLRTKVAGTNTDVLTVVDGRVGIGTTNPSFPFDVTSAGDFLAKFYSSDNKAIVQIRDNDTIGYISAENSNLSLGGHTGVNANNLNIATASGNVGIGITGPGHKLHIKDSAPRVLIEGTLASAEDAEISRISGLWDGTYVADIQFLAGDDTSNKDNGKIAFRTYTADGVVGTRMLIEEAGNVGIGTTSPTEKLELASGGKIKLTSTSATSGSVIVLAHDTEAILSTENDSATNDPIQFVLKHNLGDTELINRRGDLILSASGNIGIGTRTPGYSLEVSSGTTNEVARFASTDDDALISVGDDNDMTYWGYDHSKKNMSLGFDNAMGSTNLTISSSGNVGIGTANPKKRLHIANSGILIDGGTGVESDDHAGSARFIIDTGGSTAHNIMDLRNDNGSIVFVKGDKVGIGTTSPEALLHLHQTGSDQYQLILESTGSGGTGIKLSDTTTHTTTAFFYAKNNSAYLGTTDNEPINFQTNNTTRMTIVDSTGNVGIGTSNPTKKLVVSGDISASGGIFVDNFQVLTGDGTDTHLSASGDILLNTSDDVYIRNNGSNYVRFDGTNQNVLIGTSNTTGKKLTVAGDISASGDLYLENSSQIIWSGSAEQSGYIKANTNALELRHIQGTYEAGIELDTRGNIKFANLTNSTNPGSDLDYDSSDVKLIISESTGNVGIGTMHPGQKLEVVGNISASGTIYADQFNDGGTNLNVPDYVFEDEYVLRPLTEVEEHISESKHLPGIPSIDDINGWKELSVGDRDMKLLEKVEELTLYVISLQKQINELKNSK